MLEKVLANEKDKRVLQAAALTKFCHTLPPPVGNESPVVKYAFQLLFIAGVLQLAACSGSDDGSESGKSDESDENSEGGNSGTGSTSGDPATAGSGETRPRISGTRY